jgi:thiol-disulfide isomerase/thioredoxin
MKHACWLLLVMTSATFAQLPIEEKPPTKLESIRRKHEKKLEDLKNKFEQAVDKAKRSLVRELLITVQEDPKQADVVEHSLVILTDGSSEQCGAILKVLKEHHLKSPKLTDIVMPLIEIDIPAAEDFLKHLISDSPVSEVNGLAKLALGIRRLNINDEEAKLEACKAAYDEAEKLLKQAKALEGLTIPRAPDAPMDAADVKVSELAESELNRLKMLRRLMLGQSIPSENVLLGDQALKLTDLRGKIVVLKFGAKWCYPCQEMKPHQKVMEKRLSSQPFRYVDVDLDENPELRERWYINAVPRVFILDQEGIIRFKGITEAKALDEAVDGLLKKLAQEKR